MTITQLSHDHHMTFTQLTHDHHMTFTQLPHDTGGMLPHLGKSADKEVEVSNHLPKFVSAEDHVDELHLLGVGEEVPVVQGQVSRNLATRVLRERGGRLLVLV